MSAIEASGRARIGLGLRLSRAAASALQAARTGSFTAARVAVAPLADANTRSETILRRLTKGLDAAASVLEICHRDEGHPGWVDGARTHDMRHVLLEGRPVDMVAALRQIPSGSYDAVFSVDALEYVKAPWRVADEITRILKPGGVTYHTSVFTTRYQPQPEDYLRFTPDGLKSLFTDLECLTAEFDATERRREPARRGRSDCADIFCGSREGWRVHYSGRKGVLR
jgi:SAM-dependent methyltransferase